MGKAQDHISPDVREFILAQRMFFVATAPLSSDGHINLSPKGLDTFRVLGEKQVAYLDLTGSGNETSAHLEENGRVTVMFCAFDGPPKILRLYGRGRTILPGAAGWSDLAAHFDLLPGVRQIILIDVHRVQTSCGFGVPLYDYRGQRTQLPAWGEKKGSDFLRAYQQEKNAASIDGIITTIGKSLDSGSR